MKSCFEILEGHAEKFAELLSRDAEAQHVPEFPWRNRIWRSALFRRAHVEEFTNEQISVLHVTVFPQLTDPSPIFGFDVITGVKKPVGCYADLSPSVESWDGWPTWVPMDINESRTVPNWGTCFSNEFITIALKDPLHLDQMLGYGTALLEKYLKILNTRCVDPKLVREKQQFYCDQQRSNQKTLQVLERMIGRQQARYFVDHVLFPDPAP